MELRVIDNELDRRYEIWLGDERVGLANYSIMPGERHFVHTEVSPEYQGKNYAAILMREAFLEMRKNSKDKVVPVCSYVVSYMNRHPETLGMLKNPIAEASLSCRFPGNQGD